MLRLLLVVAFTSSFLIGNAGAGEAVTLNAATVPYSAFKIRKLKAAGKPTVPPIGDEITGEFFAPKGPGPHPAIVLTHDCRGVRPYQRERARTFATWGYATLLVNSHKTRGITGSEVCANFLDWLSRPVVGGRSYDIHGALDWLGNRPDVDASHLFIVAWDLDATLGALAKAGMQSTLSTPKPRAAVVMTPDCGQVSSGVFISSMLVITATNDDWWPPARCEKMVEAGIAAGGDISLVKLDAARGFDDTEHAEPFVLADAINPFKTPTRGVTFHYNKTATDRSLELIKSFLKRNSQP